MSGFTYVRGKVRDDILVSSSAIPGVVEEADSSKLAACNVTAMGSHAALCKENAYNMRTLKIWALQNTPSKPTLTGEHPFCVDSRWRMDRKSRHLVLPDVYLSDKHTLS